MRSASSSSLTASQIKLAAGSYDLEGIFTLDLSHKKLSRYPPILNKCPHLTALYLCHNEITALSHINASALQHLVTLDLSHNRLTSLDGIPPLPSLRCLHLAGNSLASLDNVLDLAEFFPSLEELSLAAVDGRFKNPACHEPHYAERLSTAFPKLRILDGDRFKSKYSLQHLHAQLDELSLALPEDGQDSSPGAAPELQLDGIDDTPEWVEALDQEAEDLRQLMRESLES